MVAASAGDCVEDEGEVEACVVVGKSHWKIGEWYRQASGAERR